MTSRLRIIPLCAVAALASCSDPAPAADETAGCRTTLEPGGSDLQERVQTALIDAPSGSTVCFRAGTYAFSRELSVAQRGITVRGLGTGPVFDFASQRRTTGDAGAATDGGGAGSGAGANSMSVTGAGFTIDNVTIKNSPGDGIRVSNTQNATFRRLRVSWDAGSVTANGAYAIYPVNVTGVLVEDCEVQGASDAGIYVGQSRNIIVRRNRVHGNVAGIEIENCTDSDVYDNRSYDNTAGILVFNLPNLPVRNGRRALVRNNTVEDNNRANFGERGSVVSNVPAGLGMLVMSADETEVRGNTVRRNRSSGVAVVNYSTVLGDPRDPMYNAYPETTWIHDNTFANNGDEPEALLAMVGFAPIEDILWDGSADPARRADATARLCITNNGAARFRNFNVADIGAPSTDLAAHNCTQAPLPEITRIGQ